MEKLEKSKSLDEKAYLQIKDAILTCKLPPGEFLAEVRIAESLGVSKTPIRNAMARLYQEGFLINIPYKGHFISEISIEGISEIYELRIILECHVLRETAIKFSLAELDAIESIIVAAEEAFDRGEMDRYVHLNREFHHAFDLKYGHRRISDVLTNLDEHVQRIIFYALQNGYHDLLDTQRDDHRLILTALRAGEIDSAVELMKNHLSEFCSDVVFRLSSISAPEN